MTTPLSIDRDRTAVLVLHVQNIVVSGETSGLKSGQPELLERISSVLNGARAAGVLVIYLVVQFRPGYPEVSASSGPTFTSLKRTNRLLEGTEEAQVHPKVAPQAGDLVVVGRRTGAFTNTEMEGLLKARGITDLVLTGINTSGTVLTTVRWAADIDYGLVVLEDCCADSDEEVHRVLTQKVFPKHAHVATSKDFLSAIS